MTPVQRQATDPRWLDASSSDERTINFLAGEKRSDHVHELLQFLVVLLWIQMPLTKHQKP